MDSGRTLQTTFEEFAAIFKLFLILNSPNSSIETLMNPPSLDLVSALRKFVSPIKSLTNIFSGFL